MYLRLGKLLRNVSQICFIQLGIGQHLSGLLLYKYPSDNLLPVLEQMCQGWRCWAFWGFTNGSGFLGNRWHLGCWICDVQHHHLQHGSLPASVLHHFDAKGLGRAYDHSMQFLQAQFQGGGDMKLCKRMPHWTVSAFCTILKFFCTLQSNSIAQYIYIYIYLIYLHLTFETVHVYSLFTSFEKRMWFVDHFQLKIVLYSV